MKSKFAIGCLVQWYECDIIEEYVDSLKDALDHYKGNVLVDFVVCANQDLEKCIDHRQFAKCQIKIKSILSDDRFACTFTDELVSIADYRRSFNERYCDLADVLIWGESDMLAPKQMFEVLDGLHDMSLQNNNPKYLAFFGTCKMWDDTWKPIEHSKFTDKPFIENDFDNWWSVKYTMDKDEMNRINEAVTELDVRLVSPHKFNGCGLVISSEVIRSGVNIPKSVFFVHEDSAFMYMTNKVLGDIPQYIIKNMLLVHNRNHPDKRNHIADESGNTMNERRRSNDWYVKANAMSQQNYLHMFDPNYKSFTWEDVL